MKILAIETSCDESAVCIIEATGDFGPGFRFKVLGNALASQAALHAQYGGVFPNLAKREHAKALVPLLTQVVQQAGLDLPGSAAPRSPDELMALLSREPELFAQLTPYLASHAAPDIDCIAVTHGPGLEPALWVGVNFARALATAWQKPLVAVNHMEGHALLSMVKAPSGHSHILENVGMSEVEFPILALLISGGHTELVLSREFGSYDILGATRDDAAGEAFDKVARLLGLPYPGGPEISRLAALAREKNIGADFSLTRPMLHSGDYDFSFSGLKTEVRKLVESHEMTEEFKLQVAREFEECVADALIEKTMRAVEEFGTKVVVVGGGVSANTFIKKRLAERLAQEGDSASLLVPPPEFATDNALMIALAGYFHAIRKEFAELSALRADGNLALSK
ncbi:MAG: tRNA (adenosine(37)-N6)-threonylcarbamoyltransferase complex transferase subunit TsaD [Patescibacteria group bacterium]|nr:tRNA (adenosine(37)-N6)-threonylcarbamoyltransferase complex transferase subunit TsaD [Patescibacteria group bacterium]